MAAFQYRARNAQGVVTGGIVQADDLETARRRIEGRGLTIVSLQAAVLRRKGTVPVPSSVMARRSLIVTLVLLLALALAVFAWFDPFGWLDELLAKP